MDFLQTALTFIVTLGILVTFHEYGHFWVARRNGVKVLRFSIGFGKTLLTWRDKHDTEFAISLIPLGGYVKMLDEREAPVPEPMLDQAFNRKSVLQRIAVVVAGPLANFILAILAFWLMFILGVKGLAPVIGDINSESPIAKTDIRTGDEVVAVDGSPVNTLQELNIQLVKRIGESGEVILSVKDADTSGVVNSHAIPINQWMSGVDDPDPMAALGFKPFIPAVPPVIGTLLEDGRAAEAGFDLGDEIIAVNGVAIATWQEWVEVVRKSPEKSLDIDVKRQGSQTLTLVLTPAEKTLETGERIGFIGVAAQMPEWPADLIREQNFSVFGALGAALSKTGEMTLLTLDSIKKLLLGWLSVSNLSGPITIAKVAGASASSGLEAYLGLLAYLSISLGVLNLLPIPVLDGGHLMYYLVELVKGSPVSERTQALGMQIGVVIIACIMVLALYNDIMRL